MRALASKLIGKLGFLGAVTAAAVIGGATTGIVMAAIPNSDGSVSTCYRNSGNLVNTQGSLRVIDPELNQACNSNETALALSTPSANTNSNTTAFFRVKNGNVDTATLRNVTEFRYGEPADSPGNGAWCLKVAGRPLFGGAFFAETTIGTHVFIRGFRSNIDEEINAFCGAEWNAAVYIASNGPAAPVTAWLSN